jgi:hypothetical protein
MIRPLAAFLHALDAARTAGTLSRTVLVLSRQLDNAHLLAASEGARADRAELRVAELEAQTRDWAELSGELAAEQPAADALPDLTDAAPPLATPDPLRETDYQRDRADSLMRTLHATEAVVLDLRGRLATAEREAKEARAQLAQTERAAGAHIATISALREQIAAAHRAAHGVVVDRQIPRVASAVTENQMYIADGKTGNPTEEPCDPESCHGCANEALLRAAAAEQIPGVAATRLWIAEYDDPPATKPSERPAKESSR